MKNQMITAGLLTIKPVQDIMSKKLSLFILPAAVAACTLMFSHCASKGNLSESHMTFDTLCFGRSGGFANLTEKYALSENGNVYKEVEGELQKINRIRRSRMKEIKGELNSLHLQTMDLDEVGNMTYFLEVISDTAHRVKWTESTENNAIKSFYKTLVTTLPNQNK